ncbi:MULTISPECIES: hypothetical protein [unclassified Nocardiopsis]|uniref:hypothetical protein n=1 Tax=Nocardiopsis TaxID=2013 RepID=UPI00387AFD9C
MDLEPQTSPLLVPEPRQVADHPRFVLTTRSESVSRNVEVTDLSPFRHRTATAEFLCATSGPRRHVFRGPLLYEVLTALAPLMSEMPRRTRAHCVVRLRGRDGHRAAVSWAEIDPEFAGAPFLLATAMDGVPLGENGPQLVSPGDRCGARFISAITRVDVVPGGADPGPVGAPDPGGSVRPARWGQEGSAV